MNTRTLTEEQSQAAERLRKIWKTKRIALDLTQEKAALLCGWHGQSAFAQYLHGRVGMGLEAVIKIAKVLGVEPSEIMPEILNRWPSTEELERGPELPDVFRRLPIVGIAQLGPDGNWHGKFNDSEKADGFCEYATRDPDAYCLRVKGDSMSPTIRSGWLVVVEPNSQLVSGCYVVACTTQGECMVKEYLYERNSEVTLASINETYGRITLDRAEFERLHVVGAIVPPHKYKPW